MKVRKCQKLELSRTADPYGDYETEGAAPEQSIGWNYALLQGVVTLPAQKSTERRLKRFTEMHHR